MMRDFLRRFLRAYMLTLAVGLALILLGVLG